MSVRQYIGARYVPIFSDPIQWDNTSSYEPLTVVKNQGTSYVSKRSVPEGIEITNETYWLRWADYNAQLEEYIRQVQTYTASINALNDALPIADFDANDTVKDAIDGISALLPNSAFDSVNTVDARFDTIESDGWVSTNRIANSAVTTPKVADKAITVAKQSDRYLVVIGDSFSNDNQTGSPLWWERYAGAKNLVPYTTASDGMGFVTGNNKFSVQLDNAITAMAGKDVAEVVVLGGLNDFSNTAFTPNEIALAANRLAIAAKNAFPKAMITFGVFPPFQYYGESGSYHNPTRAQEISSYICFMLHGIDVRVFDMSCLGLFYPSYFGAANQYGQCHPSVYGSKLIANIFLGGNIPRNVFLNRDNSPAYKSLVDGTHTNCTIEQVIIKHLSTDLISFDLTVVVTNVANEAKLNLSKFPRQMNNYTPAVDNQGNTKMCYTTSAGELIIQPTAGNKKYITLTVATM